MSPQSYDESYKNLIRTVLEEGEKRNDRTGVGTISLFGMFIVHDLKRGFPALTVKKLPFKTMAAELACFVKGLTDVREFRERGCRIWDENLAAANAAEGVVEDGHTEFQLGPIYGSQWRRFGGYGLTGLAGVDQLRDVINTAKASPASRRMLVSAWNPQEEPSMVLPPCHTHWQISVRNLDGSMGRDLVSNPKPVLDLIFYMRSVDVMLGLPFDMASYALLNHLIARECGYTPGRVMGVLADTHIYLNHLDGAAETLEREERAAPTLEWNEGVIAQTGEFRVENFESEWADLINYDPHPIIKMPMAV